MDACNKIKVLKAETVVMNLRIMISHKNINFWLESSKLSCHGIRLELDIDGATFSKSKAHTKHSSKHQIYNGIYLEVCTTSCMKLC